MRRIRHIRRRSRDHATTRVGEPVQDVDGCIHVLQKWRKILKVALHQSLFNHMWIRKLIAPRHEHGGRCRCRCPQMMGFGLCFCFCSGGRCDEDSTRYVDGFGGGDVNGIYFPGDEGALETCGAEGGDVVVFGSSSFVRYC
jgi:hypothetical protein